MNAPWPRWAVLRSEQIRQLLPPEEWGPWTRADQICILSNTGTPSNDHSAHPTDLPNFFHCEPHLQAVRKRSKTVRPDPLRDLGLCKTCGEPAERLSTFKAPPVMCVQAERSNSTVARLSTKAYCTDCNPSKRPFCTSRQCRATGERRRVQLPDCCSYTRNGSRLHCAQCCSAKRARQRDEKNQTVASFAVQVAIKGRRQRRHQRRLQVAKLAREGFSELQMADQLGVSTKTIQQDRKALRDRTRNAQATNARRGAETRRRVAELSAQGHAPAEIAKQIGRTYSTVRHHLRALSNKPTD